MAEVNVTEETFKAKCSILNSPFLLTSQQSGAVLAKWLTLLSMSSQMIGKAKSR